MKMQLSRLLQYLEQLPLTLISIDGTEADDVIAYISKQLLVKSKIFIMSTDKDFLQLIDDRIFVWSPTKKIEYNRQKIFDEFGIFSENFLTYKILCGDKSDNIDGIKGAGLKSVKKYITPIAGSDKFDIQDLIKDINAGKKVIDNIHAQIIPKPILKPNPVNGFNGAQINVRNAIAVVNEVRNIGNIKASIVL